MPIVKNITDTQIKQLPEFRTGYTVKVHQRIKEGGKERVQVFEGLVIARKGGSGVNATFMVRKISYGVGVERIFPIHSPNIVKLEVIKPAVVGRAKLYYTRKRLDSAPRFRKNKSGQKTA
jgi:large subunit ribosomal protein L19